MHTKPAAEDGPAKAERWRASVRDHWELVDQYMRYTTPVGVGSVAKIGRYLRANEEARWRPTPYELGQWLRWVRFLAKTERAKAGDLDALNMREALQAAEKLLLEEMGELP